VTFWLNCADTNPANRGNVDGERVARRDGPTGAGGVFYYFSDHLKTTSVITDSAGVETHLHQE
jgi:hypothetical protein